MKVLKKISAFLYFGFVCYLVFFEGPRGHIKNHPVNLIPLRKRIKEIRELSWNEGNPFNFYSNLFGNIVLFIPLPIVLSWLYPHLNEKKLLLTSLSCSILIECMQFIFERGVCDVDDVLLNFTGALLGVVLLRWQRKLKLTTAQLHL